MSDYKNLFLDFASNMDGSANRKYPFAPLKEQYSKLNIIGKDSFDSMYEFMASLFFTKGFIGVHISYPSFNKEPRVMNNGIQYYNNIAIRISISHEQDF